jgi:hypothetical protein
MGARVVEATPGASGTHDTVTAVLSDYGVEAPWVVDGAMTGAAVETYVERVLCPTLRPGDLVVADNLSAHPGPQVCELLAA